MALAKELVCVASIWAADARKMSLLELEKVCGSIGFGREWRSVCREELARRLKEQQDAKKNA